MFLVTTSTYPLSRTHEVTARYQKAVATALPSFLKRIYVLGCAGESGHKVLGIYEVADDKVTDGVKELTKYFAQFFDIEGFKYAIEPMLTAQEAIPLFRR